MHPHLLNNYDHFFLTLSKVTESVRFAVNNSLIMNMKTIQKLTTVYKRKNDMASAHRKALEKCQKFVQLPPRSRVKAQKNYPPHFYLCHQFYTFLSCFLCLKKGGGRDFHSSPSCDVLDTEVTPGSTDPVNKY